MADALKHDLLSTDYVAGEQPDFYKLTSSIAQLETAVAVINEAIGDLKNQQGHGIVLSYRPLVGPSVGRHLGSIDYLSPVRPGSLLKSNYEVNFVVGENSDQSHSLEGTPYNNRHQFLLPYRPRIHYPSAASSRPWYNALNVSTVSGITIGTPDPATGAGDASGNFTARVTDLGSLDSAGDYHISDDGMITTFTAITIGEGFKVTYTFDLCSDMYPGASLNVIPPFMEETTLCTVADAGGGEFTVTLPILSATVRPGAEDDHDSTDASDRHVWGDHDSPVYQSQTYLPAYFIDEVAVGGIIPSGWIQLYDSNAGEVLNGLTFKYKTSSSVTVVGTTLVTGSARYRIVVPGTNASAVISRLVWSYGKHDHSGESDAYGTHKGRRISHRHLLHSIDEGSSTKPGFSPSLAGVHRQPHPQLLHRYGWRFGGSISDGGDSAGNRDNAFLGDFLISGVSGNVDATEDSYSLVFGDTAGPSFIFDYSESALRLLNKDLLVSQNYKVTTRTRYLNVNSIEGLSDTGQWTCEISDPSGYSAPYMQATAPSDLLAYSIHLPNGALIEKLEVLIEEAASASLTAYWSYSAHNWSGEIHGDLVNIANGSSEGDGSDETISVTATNTIDNESNQYYIFLEAQTAGDKCFGVRVTYTWTQIEPNG